MSVVAGRFALIFSSTILLTCLPSAAQNSPKAENSPNSATAKKPSQASVQSVQSSKRHARKPHAAKPEPPATPQPALPAGPLPPLSLDQTPAVPPQVSYQSGELTIIAQNSTLGDILHAVKNRTGASFDVPPAATERVVGRFGPGPAREVLATLLNGSHFNYVMLGSAQDPNAMAQLILTPKVGADNTTNPGNPAGAVAQQLPAQGPEQMSSDGVDVENAADVGEENVDQNPPEQQNADQDGAPQGFPTDSNGQPMVKTPQQLLQELQQQQLRQQQLQQQLQQQQQQGTNPQQPVVYPNPQPNPQRPQPQ